MAKNKTGEFRVGRGLTDHVFVDVDGTLLDWRGAVCGTWEAKPTINQRLVAELKKWKEKRGGTLVVWSTGGPSHAKRAADYCGLDALCIGKPDIAVDDWLNLPLCTPHEFSCPTEP